MRISTLTIRNYRIHRELSVEFDPERSLIGGPNEVGKSTLVEAAHRCLFLRAKTGGDIQKSMVSQFHPGHPEVEICFEAGGRRWRLHKRFSGGSGTATLADLQGATIHGDEAESRLADLLGVELVAGGRGAGDRVARQWAHLWVWQGEACADPLDHANGQRDALLGRLQGGGAAAAMQSDRDSRVAARLAEKEEEIFTKNGTPKKDSPLGRALFEVQEAESDYNTARESAERLRQAALDFTAAQEVLARSQTEIERFEQDLRTVEARLVQVAALRSEELTHRAALSVASQAHSTVLRANQTVRDLKSELGLLVAALAPEEAEVEQFAAREAACSAELTAAEASLDRAAAATREARIRHELLRAHAVLFEKEDRRERLRKQLDQINEVRSRLGERRSRLAAVPEITAAALQQLQKLEGQLTAAEASLEGMAAGLEVVSAAETVRVDGRTIERGKVHILSEDSDIEVGNLCTLRIRPGGGTSLVEARSRVQDARKALQNALDRAGCESTAAAAEAAAERQHLELGAKSDEALLHGLESHTIETRLAAAEHEFLAAGAEVNRRSVTVALAAVPDSVEHAQEFAAAAASELALRDSEEAAARTGRERAFNALEDTRRTLEKRRTALNERRNRCTEIEANLKLLRTEHGTEEDLATKVAESLAAKNECEKRLSTVEAALQQLQPQLLESDKARLTRALSQSVSAKQEADKKAAVALNSLHCDGSSDPEAVLALAEARLRAAREQHATAERKARAVRLLNELFRQEQRALADRFTRPLAEKITDYLRCVFGAQVRAQLRLEANAFTGLEIVRSGEASGALSFETLSTGAREQMGAAVRLAMAEVLAEGHDGCLPIVFDDAFANSDPTRVSALHRMLDLAAARGVQVIILSCNPADYAGLGARTVLLT